jgi:hypothetical protein
MKSLDEGAREAVLAIIQTKAKLISEVLQLSYNGRADAGPS